jgi:hypothetical protein
MVQASVTVLTGYLGVSKTMRLNRVLTERHRKKYAVIVSEVGIDDELIVAADEDVFETSNGCICCTVRGKPIEILYNVPKRKGRFDGDIRAAFGDAVDAFEKWGNGAPEPCVETRGQELPISVVYGLLWNCDDIMPSRLCQ